MTRKAMDIERIIDSLLQLPTENEVVEFKEAKRQYDKDKLGRYFSALSNEANLKGKKCAWIVMGVANNKSIIGTSITEKQINEYKSEISQHTSPKSCFRDVHKLSKEGKNILLLEIPATPKGQPMSWKGHYYGRDGESLGALTPQEYDEIKNQKIEDDWSAEIISEASISDLSREAIIKAREEFTKKNPKLKAEIQNWSDETFLNKAKLTIKGSITNSAILLLGKPEAEYLLQPAIAKISWILKGKDNTEKDYEHFSCPFILSIEKVRQKIRNLKYRYTNYSLFPEEVDQYDDYSIREALNNCIAHQDYSMGGRIIVIENEDGYLVFSNLGEFIPKSVEYVVTSDSPEERYRNRFLADAMVNLNMIDTIGSGIKRLFNIQKEKYFPLPDYDLSNNRVKVTITGKILDLNFARKVAQMPSLSLEEIILLDKVSKKKPLTNDEAKQLKRKNLIEGRKPNYYISSSVAKATNTKGDYIKLRGIENDYCQKLILDYLKEFGEGRKADFENLLMDKLPEGLTIDQKKDNIKNNLQTLRRKGKIETKERYIWVLSKSTHSPRKKSDKH